MKGGAARRSALSQRRAMMGAPAPIRCCPASRAGQQLIALDVSSDREIETAFTTLVQRGAGALHGGSGLFLLSQRERIVALAARHRIPVIYVLRDYVAAGGLMSYGASIPDAYRQAGIYAGRILKGEKPRLPRMKSSAPEKDRNAAANAGARSAVRPCGPCNPRTPCWRRPPRCWRSF
jgi:hypothetical protein